MALAYNTSSNLASGTDTRSWSHGGSASARGAIVVVLGGAVDSTSGVTYGGTAMTRVQTGVNAGGESGTVSVWFLGESLPTGTQTVQVTRNTAVDAYIATCFTVTAANDTEYITGDNGSSLSISTIATSLTIPSGKQVFMAGGLYSGENALSSITDNADLTRAHSQDFGNFVGVINRKTTLYTGTGAAYTNFAWTQSADDGAWAAVAIAESAGSYAKTSTRSGTGSITASGVVARSATASLTGTGTITATGDVVAEGQYDGTASIAGQGTITTTWSLTSGSAGLPAYHAYNFDENTGGTSADYGTNGTAATVYEWTAPGYNSSTSGVSSATGAGASIPAIPADAADWTLMGWFRVRSSGWGSLIEGPSSNLWLEVNGLALDLYTSDIGFAIADTYTFTSNVWTHVAIVSETGVGTRVVIGGTTYDSNATVTALAAGAYQLSGSGTQPGDMDADEFYYVQEALSDSEIATYMATPPAAGASTTAFYNSASLTGTGSISTTEALEASSKYGTSSLSGTGTITATGVVARESSSTLSGTGTITATGTAVTGYSGGATLSSTGTITATGVVARTSTVVLTATGTITATGVVQLYATSSLTGAGVITAQPQLPPFLTSTSGRAFLDQDGNPYFVRKYDQWNLIGWGGGRNETGVGTTTPHSAFDAVASTLADSNFNSILVLSITSNLAGETGPYADGRTWDGVTPWNTAIGQLNETYWARVDDFVDTMAGYGITVFFFLMSSYTIAAGGAFAGINTTNAATFGTAIGNRYKDRPNIVWMYGADYYNEIPDEIAACQSAIAATGDTHLFSVEFYKQSSTTTDYSNSSPGTVPSNYSFSDVYDYNAAAKETRRAWSHQSKPVLHANGHYLQSGDGNYDRHVMGDLLGWAFTSGSQGFFVGSEATWQNGTGYLTSIQTELWPTNDFPAVTAALTALTGWEGLVPDLSSTFITSSRGTDAPDSSDPDYNATKTQNNYLTGAIRADGALAVLYTPVSRTGITVNTAQLPTTYSVRWIDPTSGDSTAQSISGSYNTPGNNDGGLPNWYLVFEETGDVSGTSSLSGTGSITSTGTVATSSSASLSGTGSISATGVVSISASATLTETGAVSTTEQLGVHAATSLTGSGTVTAAGVVSSQATASISGAGTISTAEQTDTFASATVSGTGVITPVGEGAANYESTVTLSGSGQITSTKLLGITASAQISGSGVITAGGSGQISSTASITGSGAVTTDEELGTYKSASVTGTGVISATGVVAVTGVTSVTGTGSITTTQVAAFSGTASISGTGAITAGGAGQISSTASITGTGSLSATGTMAAERSATLTGTGSIIASATGSATSDATLTGTGTITATGIASRNGTGTGTYTYNGTAAGSRVSSASGTGSYTYLGTAAGTSAYEGSGTGSYTYTGSAIGQSGTGGYGSGTYTYTGSGNGSITTSGSGSGASAYTGTGTGSTLLSGSGTGSYSFSSTAAGEKTQKGTGNGGYSWAGTATGTKDPLGSASGTYTWTGTAFAAGTNAGVGSGSYSYLGFSIGKLTPKGTGSSSSTYTGSSTGSATHSATGLGTYSWTGTASGLVERSGTGAGDYAWVGTATAYRYRNVKVLGIWLRSSRAFSTTPHQRVVTVTAKSNAFSATFKE